MAVLLVNFNMFAWLEVLFYIYLCKSLIPWKIDPANIKNLINNFYLNKYMHF